MAACGLLLPQQQQQQHIRSAQADPKQLHIVFPRPAHGSVWGVCARQLVLRPGYRIHAPRRVQPAAVPQVSAVWIPQECWSRSMRWRELQVGHARDRRFPFAGSEGLRIFLHLAVAVPDHPVQELNILHLGNEVSGPVVTGFRHLHAKLLVLEESDIQSGKPWQRPELAVRIQSMHTSKRIRLLCHGAACTRTCGSKPAGCLAHGCRHIRIGRASHDRQPNA